MINLLPDEQKRDFRAARMNVALIRYNIFMVAVITVLVIMSGLFYFVLDANRSAAVAVSSDNSTKAAKYNDVRKRATEYQSNLTTASQILKTSFNFTPVIFSITKLLPDGVVLDGIDLNTTSFGQQTSFTAHSKTIAQATQLKKNFQASDIFSNVYFQSLTDSGAQDDSTQGTTSASPYKIAITLSAIINKDKVGN